MGNNRYQKSAFHILSFKVPQNSLLLRKQNTVSGMVVEGRKMLFEALLCVAGHLERHRLVLKKQAYSFEWP